MSERQSYGWDIPCIQRTQRDVIAQPEKSAGGNTMLRVGTALPGDNGWEQKLHVVLTPAETAEFIDALKGDTRSTELVDNEVAVVIDSLAFMRDHLNEQGIDAPNVTSALNKIKSLITPATYGLKIEAADLGVK
jgi:Fe-S cluster assembly iron-binding protein IscA